MENNNALSRQAAQLAPVEQEHSNISLKDIIIPRLMLMANTSEAVGDEKAKLGDILNSQTEEVLGGFDSPVEIIPLRMHKTWRIMDTSKKQAEFIRIEAVTPENENLPWEDTEMDPVSHKKFPIRRDFTYNFLVLLVKEVEIGEPFPCLISFVRTSARTGKALTTQFLKLRMHRKPPYAKTAIIGVRKEKHETNSYGVFTYTPGRACTEKEMAIAAQALSWLPQDSDLRVDEDRVASDGRLPESLTPAYVESTEEPIY
jgi:hypothetical protein